MHRPYRHLLIAISIYPAWLAMMALHELGHVIHALLSGGHLERVTIPLLDFSRTDLGTNPHPQYVAWGGPIWGTVLPLILLTVPKVRRPARLFAGFCLVANGAYIGFGPLMSAGDGHDLLRHGAPTWTLVLFGFAAISSGLYLWHIAGRAAMASEEGA